MSAASTPPAGSAPAGSAPPDTVPPDTVRERATRLLRWYPRTWRDRYGDEFTELLISDIEERPRSAARTGDVARGGVLARLAEIGLTGSPLAAATAADKHHPVRVSLGTLSVALAACLALAAGMWSQLMIGWGRSNDLARAMRPGSQLPSTADGLNSAAAAVGKSATIVTSVAMLILLALAIAAALPVLATVARRLLTGGHRGLTLPAAVAVAAGVALFVGSPSFENDWVGTGGAGGLVPGGLAAFTWAITLWVTSYWAHMGALAAFPLEERTWMVISPLVLAVMALAVALALAVAVQAQAMATRGLRLARS